MGKAAIVATMQSCLDVEIVVDDDEQVRISHNNQKKKLNNPPTTGGGSSLEACLPITESRNGNAFYSAFHTLNSGIGFQALSLPLAFAVLGWTWGIVSLSLAFGWQIYTIWLLTQLHESVDGVQYIRYSRYIHLAKAAFGEKRGKLMALFPIMYLSGGTCVALITLGGGTMKHFFQIVCGDTCLSKTLTTVEWFLVFTFCAIVLAQLPNLNSIAGVSLLGAITAITYCTMIWVISVTHGRVTGASYEPLQPYKSETAKAFSVLNAIGIIAFAFRGHNLVLEIQGTMPSTPKQQAHVPMWKGVKFAYLLIPFCLYPLAIVGYWAYGNLIPHNYGMLNALYKFHGNKSSKVVLGLTCILVVINCLSSFQIYAMPVFDNLEFAYFSLKKKPCSSWVRRGFRAFFGCLALFIAVALPVLTSLAGLLGGIALPITLAYPCFMWIIIKKPKRYTAMWIINWGLGILGMALSFLVIAGAVWNIVDKGLKPNFFRPS
ncbi:lysine histidine transporter-like 8 [Telopea speciosissima]|uniref:lysine histidine transporter-like 8 n=1 Tax=Telopea speciosissima TaxID=54955 RepID=UPI001CC776CA|nr:lysine histidine transporter-like 8 [Telopea speciosissima]